MDLFQQGPLQRSPMTYTWTKEALMTWVSYVMEAMAAANHNASLLDNTLPIGPARDDMLSGLARMISSPPLPPRDELLTLLNITDEDIAYLYNMTARSGNYDVGGGSAENTLQCYCNGWARDAAEAYRRVHGYFSLVVCIFGTVANLLNVAVLTRKDMAVAPINRILTWLAVADMLVMAEYVPFASYTYLVLPERVDFPYSWAVFILFHVHFAQVLHTISICLTLALAVWRYIVIRYPEKSHILCSESRCHLAIILSYLVPVLVCSPSYFVFEIRETSIVENNQVVVLYHVGMSGVARGDGEILYTANFWMYSVVVKLLPCLVLTVLSCWLIQALYKANKRKQALKGYNDPAAPSERRPLSKSERRTDRTTKMLVAVLLLFFIHRVPSRCTRAAEWDIGTVLLPELLSQVIYSHFTVDECVILPKERTWSYLLTMCYTTREKNLVLPAQNVVYYSREEPCPTCSEYVTPPKERTLFHLLRMCDTPQGENLVLPAHNVLYYSREEPCPTCLDCVVLLEKITLFHLLRLCYHPQGKNLVPPAQNVLYYSREEPCFTCSECVTIPKEITLSYLLIMFGEVMDMLALLNGAINFILYCSMSRQFRTTFGQLFKPRSMLAKWATPSQTEAQSTYV
ncbi:unnamed protein product [Timema podura]|uniref:G-protein coupled receptors family 1 profile domain-containing protein n=1 Tax=Timema podura TaxID=61482 RepID=A0ABN7NF88_TIMPD|nr:unnamed protein product [Timema podura]